MVLWQFPFTTPMFLGRGKNRDILQQQAQSAVVLTLIQRLWAKRLGIVKLEGDVAARPRDLRRHREVESRVVHADGLLAQSLAIDRDLHRSGLGEGGGVDLQTERRPGRVDAYCGLVALRPPPALVGLVPPPGLVS